MSSESIYLEVEKEIVLVNISKSIHKTIETVSKMIWHEVKGKLWEKHVDDVVYSDTRDTDTEWRRESAYNRSFLVSIPEMWEAIQEEIRGYSCQASEYPEGGEIWYFGQIYNGSDKIEIIIESGTNR